MSIVFAITFCLLVAVATHLVHRLRGRAVVNAPAPKPMRPLHVPMDVFLDAAHSWVRMMPDGTLRVGIDAFLSEALGRIDAVKVRNPGANVSRGDTLFTLTVGDHSIDIPSPVGGVVATNNDFALQVPAALTVDPYGRWVASVRSQDHKEAIKPLHIGRGALGFLRQESARLGDFFTTRAGQGAYTLMADGGLPERGAVGTLDAEGVAAFARAFVNQQ